MWASEKEDLPSRPRRMFQEFRVLPENHVVLMELDQVAAEGCREGGARR
jgi:hypothetical protein